MRKLLLADDSVTIQRVIQLTFSGEDIQVVVVNDGEQAITRIPVERPDVVLADIAMPRKGGYDVAAFVKGRPELSHIPVLLLAGAFEPVDQTRAEQVGADGVLIKPFEPRQVIERVKELMGAVRPTLSAEVVPEPLAPVAKAPAVEVPAEVPILSLDDLFANLHQALMERDATPQADVARRESAPAATLDDYFDRLSAAFSYTGTDKASKPRSERLDEFGNPTDSSASTAVSHEWLGQAGEPKGLLAFASGEGARNPILTAVAALMARTPAHHDHGTDGVAHTGEIDGPLAPAVQRGKDAAPAPALDLVDTVTERVLIRLLPELTESLRRLVRQEIERVR